jgi:predicted AlkP superfamily pyrophosphatase or phosphodiesterase
MRTLLGCLVCCLVVLLLNVSAWAKLQPKKPPYKLGVVISVDQLRADYLMRFQMRGGLNFLMKGGAYFPLADHGLLQNMTGPGHAALLSGSYPYRNGISMNYWFNRDRRQGEYCVLDESRKIIGSDGVISSKPGMSPKNFSGSTLGDELKNVDRPSQVVAVALKDRASILMGGKRADHAYWFDDKSCQWVTSEFYRSELPAFVKKANASLTEAKKTKMSWGPIQDVQKCSKDSLVTPWAVEETLKLAVAALDAQKLGRGADTDLLLVSISSHDYLGHKYGPNHPSLAEMTEAEDRLIGQFIQDIGQRVPGGLNEVFFVLTGDHGIPPSPKSIPFERMPNENVPEAEVTELMEKTLTEAWGKPRGGKWIEFMSELQVYLSREAMKGAEKKSSDAAQVLRPVMLKQRYISDVLSKDQILEERRVPPADLGRIVSRTVNERSGDVILVLNPFFYSDSYPVTHMTHYSYDRYVPLVFWGKTFKPGVYRQIVNVVDLAPTLSSVLNVIPPAHSEGRVLNEILR